eukprot:m.66744 g.66744  ORF g.66744 m.66744 type:complete len:689 (-) comp16582_c0_seq1:42-2108(-)
MSSRKKLWTALAAGAAAATAAAVYKLAQRRTRGHAAAAPARTPSAKQLERQHFLQDLRQLFKIILPRLWSKEGYLLAIHSTALVARTFLSIYVSYLDGLIVRQIVERNGRQFTIEVLKWFALAVPATFVNSLIRYMESKLYIAFRSKLVKHCYDKYLQNQTFYRVGNLDGRISNVDQNLTEDVAQFCRGVAHLYSQVSKPLLDLSLMMSTLLWHNVRQSESGTLAFTPLLFGGGIVAATGAILKLCSPAFGQLAAEQANREGHLRFVHSRLIQHAEEVAFYNGGPVEAAVVTTAYNSLVQQTNLIFRKRFGYVMLEQFLMKYLWSGVGMVMVAIPALAGKGARVRSVSDRAEAYTLSRNLLVNAADAVERIMTSYKEVAELQGYAGRVADMLRVFDDVSQAKYQRTRDSPCLEYHGVVRNEGSSIVMSNMPIITPANDTLVRSLSLELHPGMHVLISGGNGTGKSSFFRILADLWPAHAGSLIKPPPQHLFYIPQRPYLPLGCLRDQIIYPDTAVHMQEKGISDDDLFHTVLKHAHLQHVVTREGGFDAFGDWKDILSGGEKQRVGMARLFYHKPKYALLDECTSAVSIDVEDQMYQHAKELGISLLTITHRPTLWKHHTHLLQFDGEGGCSFQPFDASTRMSLKEEMDQLESSLAGVPKMQQRLETLKQMLGDSEGDEELDGSDGEL